MADNVKALHELLNGSDFRALDPKDVVAALQALSRSELDRLSLDVIQALFSYDAANPGNHIYSILQDPYDDYIYGEVL